MSVILDALKKLDRENLFRRSGMPHIATEILRSDSPLPEKRIRKYAVVIALTAVTAAALTYAVVSFRFVLHSSPSAPAAPAASPQQTTPPPMDLGSSVSRTSPSAPTNSPASSRQAASAPSNSDSLPKSSPPAPSGSSASNQQVAPAPVSPEPVREVRGEMNRMPPETRTPAETKKPEPTANQEETGQDIGSEVKPSTPQTPTGSATDPASLRLSAIVWHEDRSKRIAVINGSITTEGSVMQGVKVEEIYADHVRLSQDGRLFELSLR